MTTELHEGPLETSPVLAAPARTAQDRTAPDRMTWREKRYQRRRRRVRLEEILAWILVPTIVFGCYWLLNTGLAAVGSSPAAIIDGIKTIMDHL